MAGISAIEFHLPEKIVSTADLAGEFPEWSVEKIDQRTGILERHVAAPGECASDLAVRAAEKLFASGAAAAQHIDFVLLCTQTPDYFIPTTACLVQDRLGIPKSAGALDFSLGSSGYIYGLGLAEGLIHSGQASRVLLLTADTYSRFLNRRDRSVRTIFSDAATATLVDGAEPWLGPFVYGSDGAGAPNLMVPAGGMRRPRDAESGIEQLDEEGNWRSPENLYMNGAEIFNFTIAVTPKILGALFEKASIGIGDIDLFVFHQANRFMLEHLRKRAQIPAEKFWITMHFGNTGSSSIPIALRHALEAGRLKNGDRVLLAGFGPGYSWGGALMRIGAGESHARESA